MKDDKNEILNRKNHDINSLRQILAYLRSEDGCSWDIAQTHKSIRANLIEETYEVVEAIDNDDKVLMREELGDLLLQVVFHSRIEEEQNNFSLDEVIDDLCRKLIRRHPHVFGNIKANTEQKALNAWEEAKKTEKNIKNDADSMKSIPPSLPSLMKAEKVVRKAVKAGYDFGSTDKILSELEEKIKEIRMSLKSQNNVRDEDIGDLLFDISAISGVNNIDMENILNKQTYNFIEKYTKL